MDDLRSPLGGTLMYIYISDVIDTQKQRRVAPRHQ